MKMKMKHIGTFNEAWRRRSPKKKTEWEGDSDVLDEIINSAVDDVQVRTAVLGSANFGKYRMVYLSSIAYRYNNWYSIFTAPRWRTSEEVRICDQEQLLRISSLLMQRIQNVGYNTEVRVFSARTTKKITEDPASLIGKRHNEYKLVTIKIYD